MAKLGSQQKSVVRMLSQGYSQKEIAKRMGISYGYVRQLVKSARDRTNSRSTTELVLRVMTDS